MGRCTLASPSLTLSPNKRAPHPSIAACVHKSKRKKTFQPPPCTHGLGTVGAKEYKLEVEKEGGLSNTPNIRIPTSRKTVSHRKLSLKNQIKVKMSSSGIRVHVGITFKEKVDMTKLKELIKPLTEASR